MKAGSRGNAIKRPRTREEAEAIATEAENCARLQADEKSKKAKALAEARLDAIRARKHRLRQGRRRSVEGDSTLPRRILRIQRLIDKIEAVLSKMDAFAAARKQLERKKFLAKQRNERKLKAKRLHLEKRLRENQWRIRRQWLRRRNLTFEEEQQGPVDA